MIVKLGEIEYRGGFDTLAITYGIEGMRCKGGEIQSDWRSVEFPVRGGFKEGTLRSEVAAGIVKELHELMCRDFPNDRAMSVSAIINVLSLAQVISAGKVRECLDAARDRRKPAMTQSLRHQLMGI